MQDPIRRAARVAMLALILTLASTPSNASARQDTPDPAPASEPTPTNAEPDRALASPRAVLRTFLSAMKPPDGSPPDLDKAAACIDFPPGILTSTKHQGARELYAVLNRIELVDYEDHPRTLDADTYTYFPDTDRSLRHLAWSRKYPGARIAMTRDDKGAWRFDRRTAETIHALWIASEHETQVVRGPVAPTLTTRLRDSVPGTLKGHLVLGLEPWQWIGILLVILVGVVLDMSVRAALRLGWHRFERRRGREVEREVLGRAVRPFGLLAAAGVWYAALDLGLLPPTATTVLLVAVRLFLMVSTVWAAFRVTDLASAWLAAQAAKTQTRYDDLLVPMVKRTVKVFIAAIGLIYIANAFQIEIVPLLTGLGIGGLAFAFAAKDTIENFFGSVSVILDRPFEIGDWVEVNGVEGTVEDLGLRSTRIRTFYNSLVTVPNATLVRATVDNYGRRRYRRFKTMINVTYATHPDTIEAFAAGIREIIQLHPYTRKDSYHVWLNAFGAHSLDILVYMFFECPDWAIELREKHRFMLDIVRLADKLGVEFAFPTQTLHLFNEEHGAEHTPSDAPDAKAERRSIIQGARAAREITADQPWRDQIPGPVEFKEARLDDEHEIRGSAGDG